MNTVHSKVYPFKTEPFEHQLKAWSMSKDKESFALFMEMGTGKSKVAIDNFSYLYDQGKIVHQGRGCPRGSGWRWLSTRLAGSGFSHRFSDRNQSPKPRGSPHR